MKAGPDTSGCLDRHDRPSPPLRSGLDGKAKKAAERSPLRRFWFTVRLEKGRTAEARLPLVLLISRSGSLFPTRLRSPTPRVFSNRNVYRFKPYDLPFRGKMHFPLFFRLVWAGRRCTAASRFAFSMAKRSTRVAPPAIRRAAHTMLPEGGLKGAPRR